MASIINIYVNIIEIKQILIEFTKHRNIDYIKNRNIKFIKHRNYRFKKKQKPYYSKEEKHEIQHKLLFDDNNCCHRQMLPFLP